MDSLNISLPESLKEFVTAQVSEGGYDTPSNYISSLIQADQKQKAKVALERELLKGLESGPTVPMTAEDWESIRDEVRRRIQSCDVR